MNVISEFDGGRMPPLEVQGAQLTFDMTEAPTLFARVETEESAVTVRLRMKAKSLGTYEKQGLIVGDDLRDWRAVPFTRREDLLVATVPVAKRVWIAHSFPYLPEHLKQLVVDVEATHRARISRIERGGRTVTLFEFGQPPETATRHHFVIGGEDAWEGPGAWVAEGVVRTLASDRPEVRRLLETASVRVVPSLSPASVPAGVQGYLTPDGRAIYGAATWRDAEPPPEVAVVRDLVTDAIRRRTLGFLLTCHAWWAYYPFSGLDTIEVSSDNRNRLSPERRAAVLRFLHAIIRNVPRGEINITRRIWHAGLARDYTLAEHNAVTFRTEVTTQDQGLPELRKTGEQLLLNLAAVDDFSWVFPG